MNKKGEGKVVGTLVVFAVMVIVAAAFLPQIFANQSQMTNTFHRENVTYTLPAVGGSLFIEGQEYIGNLEAYNGTGAAVVVDSANFTIVEAVNPSNNLKGINLTVVSTSSYAGSAINLSYDLGLEGYADDTGARSVAGLMGLFAGLALLAGGIYFFYKEGGMDYLMSIFNR